MKSLQASADDSAHLGRVHEIRANARAAAVEGKDFFDTVNQCAHRLQAMKVLRVDPRTDPIMPKVVWKIRGTCQGIIYRAVELQNALAILYNEENYIGAMILARSLIELMAFVGDLHDKLGRGVAQESLAEIDSAAMGANFATRWEGAPEDARATNVLTLLERFDRRYMKEKTARPVTDTHAILSEYVHPNWSGTAGFFGTLNYESRVEHMSVKHKDEARIFAHIAAGYSALLLIEEILKQTSDFEPAVWRISETARVAAERKPTDSP